MLRLMAGICRDIQKVKCKGGAILSMFSVLNLSVGSAKQKDLLKALMHNVRDLLIKVSFSVTRPGLLGEFSVLSHFKTMDLSWSDYGYV